MPGSQYPWLGSSSLHIISNLDHPAWREVIKGEKGKKGKLSQKIKKRINFYYRFKLKYLQSPT
jgi:hypothetical protein